jgi:isocitrate lyase
VERVFDRAESKLVEVWERDTGLTTYADAVAAVLEDNASKDKAKTSADEWRKLAAEASYAQARAKAKELGVEIKWSAEHAKTPEGYFQVRGGLQYAIAKSLAVAPFADILWMETAIADLEEAREYAEAVHAKFPEAMLAYNLSPSFNWDSTGMTDDEMRAFPEELAKLGFVFNFITYGGHQVDGVAAEDLATALQQDGMLALARLQRRIRLLESPYRTPQALVGGPRADAALAAASGRTASTKAMGKGSTHHQHLKQIEVPTTLLEEWLRIWSQHYDKPETMRVRLRPARAGSEQLALSIYENDDRDAELLANVVFQPVRDRQGKSILSVSDQNTFAESFKKKRLMTLAQLWLIHRYDASAVHYVTPTPDNQAMALKMKQQAIYGAVSTDGGQVITADVNSAGVDKLVANDRAALTKLIKKQD